MSDQAPLRLTRARARAVDRRAAEPCHVPSIALLANAALHAADATSLGMHAVGDSGIAVRGRPDLVTDALLGTGATSAPRGQAKFGIDVINQDDKSPVLAVDLPGGLDCDTGEPLGDACVRATRTVTFVAEKKGFANPASRQYTGEITVADIGCPRELIEDVRRNVKT